MNAARDHLRPVPSPSDSDLRSKLLDLCERYALEADLYRKDVGPDLDSAQLTYLNGFHSGVRAALTRAINDLKQMTA